MPLFQRKLEPVYLGRQDLSTSVSTNTLDATFINTLGGVLRQLSSLSKFAEDLFAHIIDDVGKVRARADKINGKMAKIKGIMVKLNAAEEKVSIEDIGTQKHFKSNNAPDHEIFCGDSLPKPLQDIYQLKCDAKPPLDAFNIFRDDGKCSLSYFTNPAYFFDLWLETERKKLAKTMVRRKKRKKRTEQKKRDDIVAPQRKVYKTEVDWLTEPTSSTPAVQKGSSPQPSQTKDASGAISQTKSLAETQTSKKVSFQESQKSGQHGGAENQESTPKAYASHSDSSAGSPRAIQSSSISALSNSTIPRGPAVNTPTSKPSSVHSATTAMPSTVPTVSKKTSGPPVSRKPSLSVKTAPSGVSVPVPPSGLHVPVPPSGSSVPVPPSGPSVPVPPSGPSVPVPPSGPSVPVPPSDPPVPVPPSDPPVPIPPSGPPVSIPPSGPPVSVPPSALHAPLPTSSPSIQATQAPQTGSLVPPPPDGPPVPPPPAGPPAPPPLAPVPPPPGVPKVSKKAGDNSANGQHAVSSSSTDSRNNLLEAIRKGKQLRKVEEHEVKLKQNDKVELQGMDVASILARRVAFVSDSESEDEDEEDSDWDN
jgi:WAS family protein 1